VFLAQITGKRENMSTLEKIEGKEKQTPTEEVSDILPEKQPDENRWLREKSRRERKSYYMRAGRKNLLQTKKKKLKPSQHRKSKKRTH